MTEQHSLMGRRIFVTGGAGFIGSRLCAALRAAGASVTPFDNLHPQVHGDGSVARLQQDLVIGDVRDRAALSRALNEARPEIVVHLAAETGTGQSADEPSRYCDVNVVGTATLIEALREQPAPPLRVVLAATRAVYGEGAYADTAGVVAAPPPRSTADMAAGIFDLIGHDGRPLQPLPTLETLPPRPGSVYGSSKLMQEYLLQQSPAPWDHVILRLQNVYGPGQSLRNPYTGVLSIFCQQVMAGRGLNIFEDGEIYRDFIFVDDVVSAFVAACAIDRVAGEIINIGAGRPTSILRAAELILANLESDAGLAVSGDFRAGDVRYAVADTQKAQTLLGWRPQVSFEQGVAALVAWAKAEAA